MATSVLGEGSNSVLNDRCIWMTDINRQAYLLHSELGQARQNLPSIAIFIEPRWQVRRVPAYSLDGSLVRWNWSHQEIVFFSPARAEPVASRGNSKEILTSDRSSQLSRGLGATSSIAGSPGTYIQNSPQAESARR